MEIVNVLAAAFAAFAFGAVWYMALAKPWMEAAGVPVGEDGKPANGSSPAPYLIGLVAMVFVAGMMRHVFQMAGIVDLSKAVLSGLGIGAFFITPWIALNNAFGMRPMRLTVIDGGYAIFGCALMGLILALF